MALYTHPGGQVTLLPPPEGHVSDFAHPARQWTEALYWGSGVFHALTILFISQRCYTHFWLQRKIAPEDAMLLTAWVGHQTLVPKILLLLTRICMIRRA